MNGSRQLENDILTDLTTKLRINSDDHIFNVHPLPEEIFDEDISMHDYIESECETNETEKLWPEEPVETSTEQVFEEDTSKDDPKSGSIIQTIFHPESRGFILGKAQRKDQKLQEIPSGSGCKLGEMNDMGVSGKDPMKVDEECEVIDGYYSNRNGYPIGNTQSCFRRTGDKSIIIHNHFYNFASPIDQQDNDTYEDVDAAVQHQSGAIRFRTIRNMLNYSLLLTIAVFALRRILLDVQQEFGKIKIREDFNKDQCFQEYTMNKCDEYGQLPALKEECLEWKACYSEGENKYFRSAILSEIFLGVFSRMIDQTLNNIGNVNKIFIILGFLVWYVGNFLCGYMRGLTTLESHERDQRIPSSNQQSNKREKCTDLTLSDHRINAPF